MIDLKDIEYIKTISRVGGIQKAANVIGISQPALSKRVQNLEEKLQLKLFDRLPKGVLLTDAGALFLKEGQKLIAHSNDFRGVLTNYQEGRGGHISVGVKPGMEEAFFRKSIVEFSKEFPETSLKITINATPLLAEGIKNGYIDFAMGALGYADEHGKELVLSNDLEFEHLFTIPLELFVRKGHPVKSLEHNPMGLFEYPLVSPHPPVEIFENLKKFYKEKGITLRLPHIHIENYNLVYDLVERSEMWSGVFASQQTKLELSDKFEWLGQSPLIPKMEIGLVKRKTWTVSPSAQNLINIMKRHAAEWAI